MTEARKTLPIVLNEELAAECVAPFLESTKNKISTDISSLTLTNKMLYTLFKRDINTLKENAAKKIIRYVSYGDLNNVKNALESEKIADQSRIKLAKLQVKEEKVDEKQKIIMPHSLLTPITFMSRDRIFTLSPIQWAYWNLDSVMVPLMMGYLSTEQQNMAKMQIQEMQKGVAYTIKTSEQKEIKKCEKHFNYQELIDLYDLYITHKTANDWKNVGLAQAFLPPIALAAFCGKFPFYPSRLLPAKLEELKKTRSFLFGKDNKSIFNFLHELGKKFCIKTSGETYQFVLSPNCPSPIIADVDRQGLSAVFEMHAKKLEVYEKQVLVKKIK